MEVSSIKVKNQDSIESNSLTLLSLSDLYSKNFPKQGWIVENLIPASGITCLGSVPKVGKSFLSLQIAKSVAEGQKLFNQFKTTKSKVLIVSKEDRPSDIKERFKLLKTSSSAQIFITTNPSIYLDDERWVSQLIKKSNDLEIEFVIFDSLRRIMSGDENSSQVMSGIHRSFKLFNEEGISVLFIHHFGKSNEQMSMFKARGSSDIPALVDSMIGLEKSSNNIIVFKHLILRQGEVTPAFYTKIPDFENGESDFTLIGQLENNSTSINKTDNAVQDILELLNLKPGIQQSEIIDSLVTEDSTYKSGTIKNSLLKSNAQRLVIRSRTKKYFPNKWPFMQVTSSMKGVQ